MKAIDRKVLHLLEEDPRLTADNLATMLSKEVGEIREIIEKYEKNGVIVGYRTLIDWEDTEVESVTALIELKVTPSRDKGYDKVAERIYNYPEVKDMYLMSGGYDFTVIIEGKSMKEVALFVAEKLAPSEGVLSTATHFVLRKYKTEGVIHGSKVIEDKRGKGILL
ncbi:MAG: Lrp/AsnC family transcriptional regulator [Clostridia bacterium]|nr:Lrp/AsnC family transcriptional regulator [Clostridia bacterium]